MDGARASVSYQCGMELAVWLSFAIMLCSDGRLLLVRGMYMMIASKRDDAKLTCLAFALSLGQPASENDTPNIYVPNTLFCFVLCVRVYTALIFHPHYRFNVQRVCLIV